MALMLIQNLLNIPNVQLVNTAYYSKESVHCLSVCFRTSVITAVSGDCAYYSFQIYYVLWSWKFLNSSLHTLYISLRLAGRLFPAPPLR